MIAWVIHRGPLITLLVQLAMIAVKTHWGDEWLGIWKIATVAILTAVLQLVIALVAGTPILDALGNAYWLGLVQIAMYDVWQNIKTARMTYRARALAKAHLERVKQLAQNTDLR